jgi:uncharacterized protein
LSAVFADTSAIAKRYIHELGSDWVEQWSEPSESTIIVISHITPVEMFSLLSRRQREGSILPGAQFQLENDFLIHVQNQYLSVPIDDSVLDAAMVLTNKHPLRALDAIQLASALAAIKTLDTPLTFITADNNLLAAATAEGLATDDPTAHA